MYSQYNIAAGHIRCLLGDHHGAMALYKEGLALAEAGVAYEFTASMSTSTSCHNTNTKSGPNQEEVEQARRLRADLHYSTNAGVAFQKLADLHEKVRARVRV